MGLGDTIKEWNNATSQNKAKALIFLRRHLDEGLKGEYLTVTDPEDLWRNLKERYDHLKTVILPRARYEWLHLRLQDFKSVAEYNSKMFKITSKLRLCGKRITDEEMLEKNFSTFHASNVLLQQEYRKRRFRKYSELISCLLVAEQNNELLMKNHNARPTGATAFPEVNVMTSRPGGGRRHGHGKGKNRYFNFGHGKNHNNVWHREGDNHSKKSMHDKGKKKNNQITRSMAPHLCYICGMTGNWSRTCRTPKHLVELYQTSQKEKEKDKHVEVNFTDKGNRFGAEPSNRFDEGPSKLTHVEIADFFGKKDNSGDEL